MAAVLGTTAVMDVALITRKLRARTPPILTYRTPVKLVPLIDTTVPTPPEAGAKPETVGTAAIRLPDNVKQQ